jgi:hypothetical protein
MTHHETTTLSFADALKPVGSSLSFYQQSDQHFSIASERRRIGLLDTWRRLGPPPISREEAVP